MTRYRSLLYRAAKAPAPGTPEWRAKLTASKIAATAVPSRSPHASYFSLWHTMAGTIPSAPDDEVLQRGRILEPAIAAWFQEEHPGWNIRPVRGRWWIHPDDSRMAATPDYIAEQGGEVLGLVECKSAADTTDWGKPGTDEIPPAYYDQCQWQMYCTGERTVYVPVITALRFAEYVVHHDPGHVERLVEQARVFMDSLELGIAPSVEADAGHLATYEAVRDLHPEIDGTAVQIPTGLALDYLAARASSKSAEAFELETKTLLAEAMGHARTAVCNGYTVAERRARGAGRPYIQAMRNPPTVHQLAPETFDFQEAA
ncbi:YqaJ viral recombinase family protein [Rothia sp. AR01]|uniref:YqaJ viral recombinase family protein n=1 Tax=Rothia santali TaxID=2949643 RepID=A0A9X2HDA7_9MICC|nr:YqaJ viral recombinase family protein [Rothia santali]MCP3426005.1 YqaJ viral recombinase family protein [Rothia santali]